MKQDESLLRLVVLEGLATHHADEAALTVDNIISLIVTCLCIPTHILWSGCDATSMPEYVTVRHIPCTHDQSWYTQYPYHRNKRRSMQR
jgi:hypothetical protein